MTNKKTLRKVFISGLLGGCLSFATLSAHAEEWKFALEEVKGDIQDIYAQEFKKRIEAKTNGEVTVNIYYYGTLGTSADVTELVADGALQFANATPGHLGSFVPEVQLFSIPFILSDNPEVNKELLANSEAIYDDLSSDFSSRGIQLMTMYPEGDQVWTTKKPVRKPEDFANFKMRVMVSPMLLEAYKDFGASPVAMPFGEVYGGLQMGLIDGQENPLSSIYSMKFHEVTDYLIQAKHQQFVTSVITGSDWFNDLSSERQQLISSTFKELSGWIVDEVPGLEAEFMAKIKADEPDGNYVELTEKERGAFREAALKTRQKYVEMTGDRGRAILDKYLAERAALEKEIAEK